MKLFVMVFFSLVCVSRRFSPLQLLLFVYEFNYRYNYMPLLQITFSIFIILVIFYWFLFLVVVNMLSLPACSSNLSPFVDCWACVEGNPAIFPSFPFPGTPVQVQKHKKSSSRPTESSPFFAASPHVLGLYLLEGGSADK